MRSGSPTSAVPPRSARPVPVLRLKPRPSDAGRKRRPVNARKKPAAGLNSSVRSRPPVVDAPKQRR
jgi:hypothetical protein